MHIRSTGTRALLAAALALTLVGVVSADNRVVVEPGTDQLANAIAAAGEHGTVVLAAGDHFESGPVRITEPVRILGMPGSVLISTTEGSPEYPIALHGALEIYDTEAVSVIGVTFRAAGGVGNTAVVVNRSEDVTVIGNDVADYVFGVMAKWADDVVIRGNHIVLSDAWLADPPFTPESHGIVVISGEGADVSRNETVGGAFGIWVCDAGGKAKRNLMSNAIFAGFILCKVPDYNFMIDGDISGAPQSATEWKASDNVSHDNYRWGFLVIDGANHNKIENNNGWNNAHVDMELTAYTEEFFGIPAPASHDNRVKVGKYDIGVLDCGINNHVDGPTINDPSLCTP